VDHGLGWGAAADGLLALHFAFIAFVVLGGFCVVWRPRWAWLHLPALAWGIWIEISHGICPLTPWENALRQHAGEAGYPGGFIEHYLMPIIYPPGLLPTTQWLLAVLLVSLNALLYGWAVARHRRRRHDL
jgi:hypothetical protein